MTGFREREESFEKKFAHDESVQFRAAAKRNKKIALWAVEKMGRPHDADAYFRTLTSVDLQEVGHEDVVRHLIADFKTAGVTIEESEIRQKIAEAMAQARQEIKDGT